MAKFRKARRFARKAYKGFRRYAKSDKMNIFETVAVGAAYGAIRKPLGDAIPDVQMLGSYSDNVLLGGVAGLMAWKGSGIIKKVGYQVLGHESFLSGARLASGIMPNSSGSLANINY